MKKVLLFVLLTFLFHFSYAQTLVNTKDPFTGKETKGALILLGPSTVLYGMTLGFTINNDQKYISFMWHNDSGKFGAFNTITPSNLALMFKLDNDTIFRFKPDSLHSKIINSGNSSMLAFGCSISNQQLTYLSQHKIILFRVVVSQDNNGLDLQQMGFFTNKNKTQVQKAATFMLGMTWIDSEEEN